MNKRDEVEIDGAFLEFVRKVEQLGFHFPDITDKLHIKELGGTPNTVTDVIVLSARDFARKATELSSVSHT
jgi:hypothetical protein